MKSFFIRGFTLIEVMVVTVVLAVGLIGVFRAYLTMLGALAVGKNNMAAVCLLKEKMTDIEREVVEKEIISSGEEGGAFNGSYKDFKWRSQIVFPETGPGKIKITVFNSGDRLFREVSVESYIENSTEENQNVTS